MIPLPPVPGALNETVARAFPATALGRAGADGTVLGTTLAEGSDATPVPFPLVAETRHWYTFPFDRPPTTIGEPPPEASPDAPPFDDAHAALKRVIALPPSNGATNDTVTPRLSDLTVGGGGGSGTRLGTSTADGTDGALVPLPFVAVTVQVYAFPFVKPPTRMGEPGPVADPGGPPSDDTHAAV